MKNIHQKNQEVVKMSYKITKKVIIAEFETPKAARVSLDIYRKMNPDIEYNIREVK